MPAKSEKESKPKQGNKEKRLEELQDKINELIAERERLKGDADE